MNDEPVTERSRDADFRRYLLDTFPVERSGKEEIVEDEQVKDKAKMKRLNEVISSMIPRRAISAQEEEEGMAKVLRPGEGYKRYRQVGDLPPIAKQFYEAVAKLVGFDLDMLIRAVFLTERTLEKWILNEKRKVKPKRKYISKLRGKGKQKVEEEAGDASTPSE
jgi:RNA polymerase I-specific transcription initiation factor RRN7